MRKEEGATVDVLSSAILSFPTFPQLAVVIRPERAAFHGVIQTIGIPH
jgi:hypothetical protein